MQKARLDVLENLPDIESNTESEAVDVPSDSGSAAGRKWAFNKLIIIGALGVVVVIVIAGALWFLFPTTKTVKTVVSQQPQAVSVERKLPVDTGKIIHEPLKIYSTWFKDFVIDLKDKSGRKKILMCDVVINVNNEEYNTLLNNRKGDVRDMIYQTATGKNAVVFEISGRKKKIEK